LFGYAFLGNFTLTLQGLVLPLGFLIALWLASRADVNRRARWASALTTFVLWVVSLLFSIS
jgi:prolipoprotein diacylglyceryltransferase